MKAKYIFSHETGAITTDTVFYTVWIGNSAYGQRLLRRVQPLRFLTDYFFAEYNATTADYLCKVATSLFPGVQLPLLRLRRVDLTERQFSKLLNGMLPQPATGTPNLSSTLCQLDSRFYSNHRSLWNNR